MYEHLEESNILINVFLTFLWRSLRKDRRLHSNFSWKMEKEYEGIPFNLIYVKCWAKIKIFFLKHSIM